MIAIIEYLDYTIVEYLDYPFNTIHERGAIKCVRFTFQIKITPITVSKLFLTVLLAT